MKQHTKGKLKKNWLNIAMIVLSFGILAVFICGSDFPAMIHVLWEARKRWYDIVAAILCMFAFFFAEATSIYVMLKRFVPTTRYGTVFRTTMVGQFFNCTTPFATGGQPMQVYSMKKSGIGVGIGSSVLIARYVVSQSVIAIYGIILLLFNYSYFASTLPVFGLWMGIGLTVSVGLVLLVVGLLCFPKLARSSVRGLIHFLAKIHLIKREELRKQQAEEEINACYNSFHLLKSQRGCLFYMVVLTFFQIFVQLLITFFIYRAFGLHHDTFWHIISAQLFVQVISSYFPTPGATGASELSYHQIFTKVFGNPSHVTSAMLIWRAITFYLPIVFGSFFALRLQKSKEKEESGEAPAIPSGEKEPDKVQV